MSNSLLKTERQQQILRLISENARVTVAALSQDFQVSEATIRRDLEELSQAGQLRRTHGGALRAEQAPPERSIPQRATEMIEEKRRIGAAAALLVKEGETLFLGSGTTVYEVARALVARGPLTIITNALNIAQVLASNSNIELIVLGGMLRRSELSMIGHLSEHALSELRADKVIMGAHALHPDAGLTSEYLPEIMTDRKIIHLSSHLIIVADHTKLGKVSTALQVPITAVHTLVTDTLAPREIVNVLRDRGVTVILA